MCRWSYLPCDIRLNQHFQPVIKRALDGMLTIDFRAFDLLADAGNVLADHPTCYEKKPLKTVLRDSCAYKLCMQRMQLSLADLSVTEAHRSYGCMAVLKSCIHQYAKASHSNGCTVACMSYTHQPAQQWLKLLLLSCKACLGRA